MWVQVSDDSTNEFFKAVWGNCEPNEMGYRDERKDYSRTLVRLSYGDFLLVAEFKVHWPGNKLFEFHILI